VYRCSVDGDTQKDREYSDVVKFCSVITCDERGADLRASEIHRVNTTSDDPVRRMRPAVVVDDGTGYQRDAGCRCMGGIHCRVSDADRDEDPSKAPSILQSDSVGRKRSMGFIVLILLGLESLVGDGELEKVEPDPKNGLEESLKRCVWTRHGSEYCHWYDSCLDVVFCEKEEGDQL